MNSPRHHGMTIFLHWTTALVILLAVGSVLLREIMEDEDWQDVLLNLHRAMGIFIIFLAAVRLLTRLLTHSNTINADLPKVIRLVAKAGHSALYLFLLTLPVTGWLLTNAQGKAVRFFGLFDLPILISKNRDLVDLLDDVHETGAWFFLVVVGLHISAALWHHFWRKDQVLRSMLSGSR